MTDIHFVIGDVLIAFVLMIAVVFGLGRGRVYVVGVLCHFGVAMLICGMALQAGWSHAVATLAGTGAAIVLALAQGPLLSRLKGDPFIIINLLVLDVVVRANTELHGNEGLTGLAPVAQDPSWRLAVITGIACVAAAAFWALGRGEWGRRWKALSEGEDGIVALAGHRPVLLQTVALCMCGCLAGLAGTGFVLLHGATEPSRIAVQESVAVFSFSFVGGMNAIGAVVAATFLVLPDIILEGTFPSLAPVDALQIRCLLIGLTLIGFVLWRPEGIAGDRAPFFPEGGAKDD